MAAIDEINDVLHKIEAKLYPNYLGKGDGVYIARAKAEAPLSIEDVCAGAKVRGGFSGQYDDLVEHSHIFIRELIHQLLDGFSVQIGNFFSLHCKIGGTYHSASDRIAPENLHIAFRTLRHLKELLLRVKIENEGAAGDGAYIDEIIDIHSESLNSALSPGGMIHIVGHKLKVAGDNPACGVWFVNAGDGSRIKISEPLGINRTGELFGLIPPLAPQTCRLEVVTQFSNGTTLLKEPRTIKADPELLVS